MVSANRFHLSTSSPSALRPSLVSAVVACAPIVFGGLPLALDPAAVLESLEGGVE